LIVATAIVVVLLALVVGNALAERPAVNPAATPLGSASATVSIVSDQFGFVWALTSGLQVKPESGQGGFQLPARPGDFSSCSCAVSPDGTRIAYWTGAELRVVDVARPTQRTTLYTAPENQIVSGAAWSGDGSGILFSIQAVNAPGGPDRGPDSSALFVIEASGGAARTLVDRGDGRIYVPLGWDRRSGVAAAGASGPGGYMRGYLTIRSSGDPASRWAAIEENIFMASVEVSNDQRFVLAEVFDQTGSTLRWWKLTDFGAIQSGPRIAGPRFDSAARPKWRPFTSEIGWIEGGVLQLLDVERGVRTVGGTFPPGDHRLTAFRQDGSAVLASTGVLLELSSGRTAVLSSTGDVAGSVRFPPTTAPPASPTATATPYQTVSAATTAAAVRTPRVGACSDARATTRQVLDRYFSFTTSGDVAAVLDCFAKVYREQRDMEFSANRWVRAGPLASLSIRYLDTVNGCDRFAAQYQFVTPDPGWPNGFSIFYSVGPESGVARIFDSGTGLAAPEITRVSCQ
jgi:hypothetical protein